MSWPFGLGAWRFVLRQQGFGVVALGLVPVTLLTRDAEEGLERTVYVASTVGLVGCVVLGVFVALTQYPPGLIPPYLRRDRSTH